MNIERLPFDQYQRYRLVADLIQRLVSVDDAPLRVLDVGGRTALLREFLPDQRIELVDMEASHVPGLVLGDGSALPFATESFDVVCAFDTLEHVPPDRRVAFVEETWRVTRKWVMLAGPYDAPRVRRAERLLARFIKTKLGFEHRYLGEHLSNGLPSRQVVEDQLTVLGGQVLSVGHANLDRWLALMGLELYLDADPALRAMAGSVFEFYNRSLYASDHAAPVYRHVVIGAFSGAPLPDIEGLLEPPVAPKKTLEPFTKLSQALMAFDAERSLWDTERKAFRSSVETLENDLRGHRDLTERLSEEVNTRKRVTGDLRSDLKGHRAALKEQSAARKEAEKAARTKELEVGAFEKSLRELQRDLDGHRALCGELGAERDALEAVRINLTKERDDAFAVVQTLGNDLEGHKVMLSVVREEKGQLERLNAALEKDLEGHRAVLSDARLQNEQLRAVHTKLLAERKASKIATKEISKDLKGHKGSLKAARVEIKQLNKAVAALEKDLEGHRGALADVVLERNGLKAEQVELAHKCAASETAAKETLVDLDGHRASLKQMRQENLQLASSVHALEKDLEGHRASLADAVAQREAFEVARVELTLDLKGHKGMLKELRLENKRLEGVAEDRGQDLEGHRAALADAAAQLSAFESTSAELVGERDRLQGQNEKCVRELVEAQAQAKQAEDAVKTIESDLRGQAAALKEEQSVCHVLKQQATELESDLAGHRGSLKDLALERDGALEAVRVLSADLDGHRGALFDRDREIKSLRDEIVELRELLDAPEEGNHEHRQADE